MSEVKRYWVPNGTLADQSGWHQDDNQVVLASDHDVQVAGLREELAERKRKHLRSCQIAIEKSQLAKERHAELIALEQTFESMRDRKNSIVDFKQRLTAAEQRNSELTKLLMHFASCADVRRVGTAAMDAVAGMYKPTESGASDEQ